MKVKEYLCPVCEEEAVPDLCEDGLYHCSNCGHLCGKEDENGEV